MDADTDVSVGSDQYKCQEIDVGEEGGAHLQEKITNFVVKIIYFCLI